MTLQEIKDSDKLWLTAEEVSDVVECNPNSLRAQAQSDPDKLGFPVTVINTRVKIVRKRFLEYLGEAV